MELPAGNHVFISFYNSSFLCLTFQVRRQFFLWAIIHFLDTAIVQNKYWLCLFSKCCEQNFCFIENALSVSKVCVKKSDSSAMKFNIF